MRRRALEALELLAWALLLGAAGWTLGSQLAAYAHLIAG